MKNKIKGLLALVLSVLIGQAWAADPVATWTDFNELTSGNIHWRRMRLVRSTPTARLRSAVLGWNWASMRDRLLMTIIQLQL